MSNKQPTFEELFIMQANFQEAVEKSWPHDDPAKFEYHIAAMVEELGEILKADKRWKTHRNATFIPEEKLDEIADMFITAMNIAMWSGFSAEVVAKAIKEKITENFSRLEGKKCS